MSTGNERGAVCLEGNMERERERIWLSPPDMPQRARELLLEAYDSNWIAPLGPHVDALEREFAERVQLPSVTATVSGTAALHLAMILLNVRPGDEVLCSTFTFAATANAICYCGAKPVFIDSDRESWNMDPELLEAELTELAANRGQAGLPKAVIAVDLYGQCANYAAIEPICRRWNVPLVEDAAESLGARYHNRCAGEFGDMSIFSFNGNKIITTSGGGMFGSHDPTLCERAKYLATQARDPAPHYQHSQIGYNYRMSNLLAALGRAQLEDLDRRVAVRRAIFDRYRTELAEIPGIDWMPQIDGGVSTRWLTCMTIDPQRAGFDRETLRLRLLSEENAESRPLWKPMHLQPVFAKERSRLNGVTDELFEYGLCLPSGSGMTQSQQSRVIRAIRKLYTKPT